MSSNPSTRQLFTCFHILGNTFLILSLKKTGFLDEIHGFLIREINFSQKTKFFDVIETRRECHQKQLVSICVDVEAHLFPKLNCWVLWSRSQWTLLCLENTNRLEINCFCSLRPKLDCTNLPKNHNNISTFGFSTAYFDITTGLIYFINVSSDSVLTDLDVRTQVSISLSLIFLPRSQSEVFNFWTINAFKNYQFVPGVWLVIVQKIQWSSLWQVFIFEVLFLYIWTLEIPSRCQSTDLTWSGLVHVNTTYFVSRVWKIQKR